MKNVLKIIGIVVLILFAILSIHTIRNYVIISSLQNKIQEKANSNNIYRKIQNMEDGKERILNELYKKDEKIKYSIIMNGENTDFDKAFMQKSETYEIGNTITRFVEYMENGKEEKVMYEDKNNDDNENMSVLVKYFDEDSLFINCIKTLIKSEKVDNKDYYVIISNDSNYSSGDYSKIYVDKETALPMKIVEPYDNGEYMTYITYEFGTVTDKDFEFPDVSQYKKSE